MVGLKCGDTVSKLEKYQQVCSLAGRGGGGKKTFLEVLTSKRNDYAAKEHFSA